MGETGARARAEAGMLAVFAELPRLLGAAVRTSWQADRWRTAIVAGATIGAGMMATFGLLATQRILVELFAAGPTPQRVVAALPALAALAAAGAVRAGMSIVTGYAQNSLGPRVDLTVQRALFEVTTAVRLEAFDADAFAEDMERASRGSESVMGLVEGALDLLAGLVSLLAVAAAVIVIHPLLLIALLSATLPGGWASLRAGHERYRTFIAGSVRRRRLWLLHRLMAERESATELRAYGLRRFLLDQYDRVMGAETRIQLDLARRVTTTTSLGSVVGGVATGGVYLLLAVLLHAGRIPLADAAARAADRAAPGPLSELAVRAVGLTYPDRDIPAVNDVTLTIHRGQTVAFVGENGSGKTTLAAMIAGLRTPDAGTITWNGTPLADHDRQGLRARIGVVTQEYHKWPFTAATNIALGDMTADPDRERIEAAAVRAVAHDMILELPNGYDTLLDRTFAGGQDLSGGQWQRITAARGFLRTADLLIMDEPSSALDPRAEDALFQAIRDRQGTATTILITHRLANVRHADHIFVLHHGALVESGSHDELIAASGRYADLFTLQAAGYHAEAAAGDRPTPLR